MATESNHPGTWLALLIGGLVLAVCIILYLFFSARVDVAKQAPRLDVAMPSTPSLPQGPKMPNPPIPVPK